MRFNFNVTTQIKRWLEGLGSAVMTGGAHTVKLSGAIAVFSTVAPKAIPSLDLKTIGLLFASGATASFFAYLDANPLIQNQSPGQPT